jgi:hypothetical protein
MSNDSSTSPSTLTPPAEPAALAAGSAFSVDRYADRLMDELFEDVEGILGTDADPPAIAPPASDSRLAPPEPEPSAVEVLAEPELEPALDEIAMPWVEEPAPEAPAPYSWIDTLMVAVTGVSLTVLTVVGVAAYYQSRQQAVSPAIAPTPVSSEHQEFAAYMKRSLNTINRRTGDRSTVALAPESTVPTVPVDGSSDGNQPAGVLERVYIPVYQPPEPTAVAPATPTPSVQPVAPTPVAPPRLSSEDRTAVAPTPATIHTLVGVLELGDRSAALFDIAGVTQRVYVGESIGSSGWTLVSVANQEAIVRRNGEVRSIYIGQQF